MKIIGIFIVLILLTGNTIGYAKIIHFPVGLKSTQSSCEKINIGVHHIAKWTCMIYASWDTTLCINDTKFLIEELKKVGSSKELNIVVLLDTMYPKDETFLKIQLETYLGMKKIQT